MRLSAFRLATVWACCSSPLVLGGRVEYDSSGPSSEDIHYYAPRSNGKGEGVSIPAHAPSRNGKGKGGSSPQQMPAYAPSRNGKGSKSGSSSSEDYYPTIPSGSSRSPSKGKGTKGGDGPTRRPSMDRGKGKGGDYPTPPAPVASPSSSKGGKGSIKVPTTLPTNSCKLSGMYCYSGYDCCSGKCIVMRPGHGRCSPTESPSTLAPTDPPATGEPTPAPSPTTTPSFPTGPTTNPVSEPSPPPTPAPTDKPSPAPTPPPTGPPTEAPVPPPVPPLPGPTPAPTDEPSPAPTLPPIEPPTEAPVPPPIAPPFPGPTSPPTPVQGTLRPTFEECPSIAGNTIRGFPLSHVFVIRENGGSLWGWYQNFTFGVEEYDGTHLLYAGAGQNNAANEGTYVGTAVVTVAECDENGEGVSTVEWNIPGDSGLCIQPDGFDEHVFYEVPMTGGGGISFAPGQYENVCCIVGEPCFVILHSGVDDFYCPDPDDLECGLLLN